MKKLMGVSWAIDLHISRRNEQARLTNPHVTQTSSRSDLRLQTRPVSLFHFRRVSKLEYQT